MSNFYKHNKKRNIGLIAEFFSRHIAQAFIEGRHSDIAKARAFWDKHIHPKSLAYAELQVFSALHESDLRSKDVAYSLLQKAKKVCEGQSQAKLDAEKAQFINEVSYILGDKNFFDKAVPDYKSYATVQVLMNAWRGTGFKGSLIELSQLEDNVLAHVLTEKKKSEFDASSLTTNEVDNIVVKIMTEKFNTKYSNTLNDNQKTIVQLYTMGSDNLKLNGMLTELRTKTLKILKHSVLTESYDGYLKTKLKDIATLLETKYAISNETVLTDDIVTFYMSVAQIKEELESKS